MTILLVTCSLHTTPSPCFLSRYDAGPKGLYEQFAVFTCESNINVVYDVYNNKELGHITEILVCTITRLCIAYMVGKLVTHVIKFCKRQ